MNLVFKYFDLGIEGIPVARLKEILYGRDTIRAKTAGNGMIMLTTNKIIKCVDQYYSPMSGELVKKKVSNQCYYVQKGLGINGVANNNCTQCHANCIELLKAGNLSRKK